MNHAYNEIASDVARLRAALESRSLSNESDRRFADSLLKYADKHQSLSHKQYEWVKKLSRKALTKERAASPNYTGFGNLHSFMCAAQEKLKWPKLHLDHQAFGLALTLSLAGPKSKYAGSIMLTDGKPFGENRWYGYITADGDLFISPKAFNTGEAKEPLVNALNALNNDPAGTVKDHGHKTGNCCFCSTKLTSDNSVKAGFGPVCAKKWGLENEWKTATEN